MSLFDLMNRMYGPENKAQTQDSPSEVTAHKDTANCAEDDYIRPEETYRPDIPVPVPANVPHVSLTYDEAAAQGWHFRRKSGKRIRITRYTGTERNVIIPAEIDGSIVNELGEDSFFKTDIVSVMLPVTLQKISDGCFRMSKVQRVVFEDGMTRIPNRMFEHCEKLSNVRLSEHIYVIGRSAFYGCKNLRYISITNSKRNGIFIKDSAFEDSGLEGFALRPGTYRWMNGTVFQNTPMQRKYKLILSPDRYEETVYDVQLVGTEVHQKTVTRCRVKFPPKCFVSLEDSSLSNHCFLDLSECRFSVYGKVLPHSTASDEHIQYPMGCEIRIPQGYRGDWFPKQLCAKYPDGTPYTCYTGAEKLNEDSVILTLYGTKMHSYSVTCKERHVIIRIKDHWPKYDRNAIDSKTLEHLTLERIYEGKGCLFNHTCRAVHCVEWHFITAYIPSSDLVGDALHAQLLQAFCMRKVKGKYIFFDAAVIDRLFTDEKTGSRLSQKQRILLAADVLRSTDLLFPNREYYARYLHTHQRYAILLCKNLPEEYAVFLRRYYETE